MVKILQKEDPILRKISRPVEETELEGKEVKKIVSKMITALKSCDDGVAIAAPQIGESIRIFVVSPKIFEIENGEFKETHTEPKDEDFLVFINPEIVKKSSKKVLMEEGCLSVRWLYGKIKRYEKVTIKALDQNGQKINRGASGILAEVFQHEIDHLDGKLFVDQARDIFEMKPEEINANKRK